jgi:GDP-mannose 6-dehydrogenase
MKISIFGMGYVGCVSAACLASNGHKVIGVDVSLEKVNFINDGISPILEEGISDLIKTSVSIGNLTATTDVKDAILNSDISLITVGTPSEKNGKFSLHYIEQVSQQIGKELQHKEDNHIIVYRSTIGPGTTEERLIPILEKHSGKACFQGFDVCYNPEFLREGTSIKDYYDPPYTIIGTQSNEAFAIINEMYSHVNGTILKTSIRVAESVKFAANIFHAIKICFINEISAVLSEFETNSMRVSELLKMGILSAKRFASIQPTCY